MKNYYLLFYLQFSACVNFTHIHFSKKYLAAIFYLNYRVSTGVMYRLNTVLTSAVHLRSSKENYIVKTQRYNLSQVNKERFQRSFRIKAIHVHPKYRRTSQYIRMNVAIIILERQVDQFTGINLDMRALGNRPGIELQLWGWGQGIHDIAQTQTVNLDSLYNCTLDKPLVSISTNEICVQSHPLLNLSSGAPLIYLNRSQPVLVGIGSWKFPFDPIHLFVRMNRIFPWIFNQTTF